MKNTSKSPLLSQIWLITLLLLSSLQLAVSVTTNDKYCNQYICLSVTIRDASQTAEIQVATTLSNVGWVGIGIGGTVMVSADLTAHWQNADGSLTISRRQSVNHVMPPAMSNQSAYTNLLTKGVSAISSSTPLQWDYLRPLSLAEYTITKARTPFIWAFSTGRPSSANPSANIFQHAAQGTFNLDLSKVIPDTDTPSPPSTSIPNSGVPAASSVSGAVNSGSAVPSQTAASSTTNNPFADVTNTPVDATQLSNSDIMIIIHGSLMSAALGILLPFAIYIARYKRKSRNWVRTHYTIQLFVLAMIIGGGYLGYQQSNGVHLKNNHQIIGVTLLGLIVLQLLLGFFIHYMYDPSRLRRPFRNEFHKVLGRAVLILSVAQIPLGLLEYGTPKIFFIVYWLWIGVLVIMALYFEVMKRSAKKLDKMERVTSEVGWRQDQIRYEELHHPGGPSNY